MPDKTNKPEWWEVIIDAADKFVVTPREQMEYDAQLARARADETLAAAQLAAAGQQNQMLNTGLMIAAVGVIGLLAFNMMKN
jgi:hypothetical protein